MRNPPAYERLQINIWKGPRNNILTSNKLLVFQDHHPLPFLEEALMSFQISHTNLRKQQEMVFNLETIEGQYKFIIK